MVTTSRGCFRVRAMIESPAPASFAATTVRASEGSSRLSTLDPLSRESGGSILGERGHQTGSGQGAPSRPSDGELRDRAGVSVIWRGPFYSGGQIDATLELHGERLTIEVEQQALGPFKRGAVKRLFGEAAPDGLKAGRPVEIEFEVAEAKISFPRKSGILFELPGKPKFGASFFQWSDRAESGSPTAATREAGKAMFGKSGRRAREQRQVWREALERAGARP
jgi:hypothetical protein